MCKICAGRDAGILRSFWDSAAGKADIALFPDYIGDGKPSVLAPALITTADEAGGGKNVAPGNPIITVGAPSAVGTINSIGDEDYYQVTLTAGTTYEIGLYSLFGGPNGVNLTDPYLELYASNGTTMIVSADGGANTTYNEVNSGFDVLLTYTPEVSGTYYINARAFSNSSATPNGDSVGDYELFVRVQDPNDPNIYRPYYDVDDPLYAIDWGTQVNRVNQSVRNPDGNEGTRDTGNAQGVIPATNPNIVDGKNVITIYFAKAGDVFTALEDPTNPGLPPVLVATGTQQWERDAVWTSLHEFEKVADVVYVEVDTREEADFFFATYTGTPGPVVSLLGSMSPPDYPNEGLAQFNSGDERWNETNLAQGGFSFVTLIHEFGHGHGLAHPHDNGGHSGVMRGVESEGVVADYTTGDFALNQGVFTMMSYEDGWQTSPYGNAPTDVGYGYLGGLMAFDIAAIQDKYGVNEDWAKGNDVYALKDVNAAGTFYSSIWDGGGTDEIVYGGARNATIDLRPATLQYEEGGGGRVCFAHGIYGGYTIANGVTIENATGGSGNDTIVGNDVANKLKGGAGHDSMKGLAGNDVLDGGTGADYLDGGLGNDTYYVEAGDFVVERANQGLDYVWARTSYTLAAVSEIEIFGTADYRLTTAINLTGNDFNNQISGNNGINVLKGGGGNDVLNGMGGADTLEGGAGADTFRFAATADSAAGAADRILDFVSGLDKIDLSGIDAIVGTPANDAFSFIGGNAFSGVAGQLRYQVVGGVGNIYGDTNGDGVADLHILVGNGAPIVTTDFVL